eukprot:COSAG03_NODE_1486_length_3996_cov_7.419040_4_plen_40_part_01
MRHWPTVRIAVANCASAGARDLSVSWESNKVYQAIDPRGL